MYKTDFFELPIGDRYRECIEVETDYDRGVADERARWETKRCAACNSFPQCGLAKMVKGTGCGLYESGM